MNQRKLLPENKVLKLKNLWYYLAKIESKHFSCPSGKGKEKAREREITVWGGAVSGYAMIKNKVKLNLVRLQKKKCFFTICRILF